MTHDDIIRIAREAGFWDADKTGIWIPRGYWDLEMQKFAYLVAAHEREECAKICEGIKPDGWRVADIIRARGEK